MNRLLCFAIIAAVLACALGVQADMEPPTLDYVLRSAATPSGQTTVWVLASDNQPDEPSAVKLFYSLDSQASYTTADMALVDGHWEGTIPNPASGTVYYYARAADAADASWPITYGTQSPLITTDAMPPALGRLAIAAVEASGDVPYDPTAKGYNNNHDITSMQVGYSAGKIYGRMTTVGGTYPVSSGGLVPAYIYAYSIGIANPDSEYNSQYVYSMLYANVALLGYSPGLYRVDTVNFGLTKIGNISYNITGGALTMSCSVADLLADPYFGAENPSGHYGILGTTAGYATAGGYWAYDLAGPCRFYRETPSYTIGVNQPPVLSNHDLNPPEGSDTTYFQFQVRYTDPDGNLPVYMKVFVTSDGVHFDEHNMGTEEYDFAGGVDYSCLVQLPVGVYGYYFEASDGMATGRLPDYGFFPGPRVGVESFPAAGWINPGWNWISVPLQPFDPDAGHIFGDAIVLNKLYRWNPIVRTIELCPDDFQTVELGNGYLLLSSIDQQPSVIGTPAQGTFGISIPMAGWRWFGDPKLTEVTLSSMSVRKETTGEVRTAQQDNAAADPWLNWNFLFWRSDLDTAGICTFPGAGGDDDRLRPWYGYRLWSNTEDLTLLVP